MQKPRLAVHKAIVIVLMYNIKLAKNLMVDNILIWRLYPQIEIISIQGEYRNMRFKCKFLID